MEGLIESVFLVQPLDGCRIRMQAHHHLDGITGDDQAQPKSDEGNEKEDKGEPEEQPNNENRHWFNLIA